MAKDGFTGPRYELWREDMARYAMAVLDAQVRSGMIYKLAAEQGRPATGATHQIRMLLREDKDARDGLVHILVAKTLPSFRKNTLITGAWKASEGAGLQTYFHAIRPVRAQVKRPQNPVTEVWGYMQSAYCRTCDESLGDVTRGWVATEDYYDSHVSWGGHDELEHDVVVTYGATSPGEDQEEALLRELWWERYARLQRAAEELLAGNQHAAHHQAREIARVTRENPGLEQVGVILAPASQ